MKSDLCALSDEQFQSLADELRDQILNVSVYLIHSVLQQYSAVIPCQFGSMVLCPYCSINIA